MCPRSDFARVRTRGGKICFVRSLHLKLARILDNSYDTLHLSVLNSDF